MEGLGSGQNAQRSPGSLRVLTFVWQGARIRRTLGCFQVPVRKRRACLFELLDARFPEKEASDAMSENLTEIFSLKAREGESLKAWYSRASEFLTNVLARQMSPVRRKQKESQ